MAERLPPEDVEAIARRVVELLQGEVSTVVDSPEPAWLDATTFAAKHGRTAQWAREHHRELGGRRVGNGKRPRYEFPANEVSAGSVSRRAEDTEPPANKPNVAHRRRRRTGSGPALLPIKPPTKHRKAA